MCYRLLSGRLPFLADTAIAMAQKQVCEQPTPRRARNRRVSVRDERGDGSDACAPCRRRQRRVAGVPIERATAVRGHAASASAIVAGDDIDGAGTWTSRSCGGDETAVTFVRHDAANRDVEAAGAVAAPPDLPAPSSAEPEPQPAVAFVGVRALVTDGDRLREREGVLRIADGNVVIAGSSDTKVLTPLTAITGLHFSRSRQPRWRDGSGKEVALRVDLGRFGFFRGDRNWLILTTATDPVILSLGDPQLKPVMLAFETRTGYTVKQFQ